VEHALGAKGVILAEVVVERGLLDGDENHLPVAKTAPGGDPIHAPGC
jgi:hypothetical protein